MCTGVAKTPVCRSSHPHHDFRIATKSSGCRTELRTLKSGSVVIFLKEPVMYKFPLPESTIFAFVEYLRQQKKETYLNIFSIEFSHLHKSYASMNKTGVSLKAGHLPNLFSLSCPYTVRKYLSNAYKLSLYLILTTKSFQS